MIIYILILFLSTSNSYLLINYNNSIIKDLNQYINSENSNHLAVKCPQSSPYSSNCYAEHIQIKSPVNYYQTSLQYYIPHFANHTYLDCFTAVRTDFWLPYNCYLPYYCGNHLTVEEDHTWYGRKWYVCYGDLKCDDSESYIKYCANSFRLPYFDSKDSGYIYEPKTLFHVSNNKRIDIPSVGFEIGQYQIHIKNFTIPYTIHNNERYILNPYCTVDDSTKPTINSTHICKRIFNETLFNDMCRTVVNPTSTQMQLISFELPHYYNSEVHYKNSHICTDQQINDCIKTTYIVDNVKICQFDLPNNSVYYCVYYNNNVTLPYSWECYHLRYTSDNTFSHILKLFTDFLAKTFKSIYSIIIKSILSLFKVVFVENLLSNGNNLKYIIYSTFYIELIILSFIIYYLVRDLIITTILISCTIIVNIFFTFNFINLFLLFSFFYFIYYTYVFITQRYDYDLTL